MKTTNCNQCRGEIPIQDGDALFVEAGGARGDLPPWTRRRHRSRRHTRLVLETVLLPLARRAVE